MPLFYPSYQSLSLADVIFEEVAERVPGFIDRLGAAWYWQLPAGTTATFRLDYIVTEERWDIIRGEATNPRAGLFSAADFPFATYSTLASSPPYIHELQRVAEWSNRLYFQMGHLIADIARWLQMLHAVLISPHVAPPSSFPYLSPVEREMVRYAVEELDGRFNQRKLYEVFGDRISRRRLSNLAQEWESLGMLTPRPRRVTYALMALVREEEPW